MSAPSSCCSPCDQTEVVEVPGLEGDAGTDGTDGADGTNAYTITTAGFTTPAVAANVTLSVADNTWMQIGQKLFIQNAGVYEVVSKSGTTSVTVKNKGYTDNIGSGVVVASGAGISPGGTQPTITGLAASGANSDITSISGLTTALSVSQGGSGLDHAVAPVTVYASGTAYTLTTSPAALNFGTTDPQITIAEDGLYLIFARVRLDYVGATYAANQVATFKLRKTSGTPADVANSSTSYIMSIVTTNSRTAEIIPIPVIAYQATAGDVITIFGSVDALPGAGSMQTTEASLVALRVSA